MSAPGAVIYHGPERGPCLASTRTWSLCPPGRVAASIGPFFADLHSTGDRDVPNATGVTCDRPSVNATALPELGARQSLDPGSVVRLAGRRAHAAIAQASDGTIYVALATYGVSGPSHLARLKPDGSIVWTIDLPESATTPTLTGT